MARKKTYESIDSNWLQNEMLAGAQTGERIRQASLSTAMPDEVAPTSIKPDNYKTFMAGFSNAFTLDFLPTANERGSKAFRDKKAANATAYRDSIIKDKTIDPEDKMYLLESGVQDKFHQDSLMAYKQKIAENYKTLEEGSGVAGIAGSVTGALVSPETLPLMFLGGGKVVKAGYDATKLMETAKTVNDLNKARKTAMLTGMRDQALLGGASGYMYDKHLQALNKTEEDHSLLAGTIGFLLGGGIGAVVERNTFNAAHQAVIDKFAVKSVKNALVPDQEQSIFNNRFTGSPAQYLMSNPVGAVREFANKIVPAIAPKVDGQLIKRGDSIVDVRGVHEGMYKKAEAGIREFHNNAVTAEEFKGTSDDWSQHIGNKLSQAQEEQASHIRAFNNDYYTTNIKPLEDQIKSLGNGKIPEKMQLGAQNKRLKAFEDAGDTKSIKETKKKIKELEKLIKEKTVAVETNKVQKASLKEQLEALKVTAKEEETKFISTLDKKQFYKGTSNEVSAMEHIGEYFGYMRNQGVKVGEKTLSGTHENMIYMPTDYNFSMIQEMDRGVFTNHMKQALARAGNDVDDTELNKVVDNFYKLSSDAEIDDYSFLTPTELNANQYLKNRKLKVDRAYLASQGIISNDIEAVMGHYSFHNSRRLAAKEILGTTDLKELRSTVVSDLKQQMLEAGMSSKEIGTHMNQLEAMLADAVGLYRMDKTKGITNKAARMSGTLDMLVYGGAFALNATAELGTVLWRTGLKSLFNGEFKDSVVAVKDAMFKGGKINNDMMREVIYTGAIHDAYSRNAFSKKMAAGIYDIDAFENKMHNAADFMSKWTGLKGLTVSSQMFVGGSVMKDIAKFAKAPETMTAKDIDEFLRMGIDKEDLVKINQQMDAVSQFNSKGELQSFNIDEMDEFASRKIKIATKRAINETVLTSDGMYVPSWLVKGDEPLIKLFTRFLNYPIQAHNAILARGMSTDKAGLITATVVNAMAYTSIKYLQEQAQLATGAKDKKNAEFDVLDNPDHWGRTVHRALSMSSGLGVLPVLYQDFTTLTGIKPDDSYTPPPMSLLGPSLNRIQHVYDFTHNVAQGNVGDALQYKTTRNLIPFISVPGISEGVKILSNKYRNELNDVDEVTVEEFNNAFAR